MLVFLIEYVSVSFFFNYEYVGNRYNDRIDTIDDKIYTLGE